MSNEELLDRLDKLGRNVFRILPRVVSWVLLVPLVVPTKENKNRKPPPRRLTPGG